MSKNVLVVLSGSGVFDGTEIHEAVITLLALAKKGCLLYTSPSPRDRQKSRMPSSA